MKTEITDLRGETHTGLTHIELHKHADCEPGDAYTNGWWADLYGSAGLDGCPVIRPISDETAASVMAGELYVSWGDSTP